MLNSFPWGTQMTTRIPGPCGRQGAPSAVEPQTKDDALLLRAWFPNLRGKALKFFIVEWRKTGLPLSDNHEAANKLHDQLFFKGAPPADRPRSLLRTLTSGSGFKRKSLEARAVQVPPTPAPAPDDPETFPEITSIELTFASTATGSTGARKAPATFGAAGGMRPEDPEDEELCKELDTILEDWTQWLKIDRAASRQDETPGFREAIAEHCKSLRRLYKARLEGAEDQNILLLEVTAHISDLLSVVSQSENFHDLAIVAKSATDLLPYYPDAAPHVDLSRRLAETFKQLVVRPDGSRRRVEEDCKFREALANAIIASDVSSARALLTTAFQYCGPEVTTDLCEQLQKADGTRYSRDKRLEYFDSSLEHAVQTIRKLSMRGSDREAVELFRIAVLNAYLFKVDHSNATVASRLLEAYRALSGQPKYQALQDRDLRRALSRIMKALPNTEAIDASRNEIKAFKSGLLAPPEISSGGEIVSTIKKLEEDFAKLPDSLAANVGALLRGHIQEFLESASTSSESPDERGVRRETLLGALNYAFAIQGALASLASSLSVDEVRAVRSWFGMYRGGPITEALNARLKALGARDEDW
jgi:hypothetical protein